NTFCPGGEFDFEFQRGAVAGKTISIAKSGVSLVQRVPRRPETVQIEETRLDVSLAYFGKLLPQSFNRAEVAVAIFVLDLLHLLHDVICSLLEAWIAVRDKHQRHSRQIMPGDVTGEISAVAIPTRIAL